jgi:folate-binding protein YgfZ
MSGRSALQTLQEKAGARFTEIGGVAMPSAFGDTAGEYAQLHEGAAVVDLSFRALLRFTGAERGAFLQNMLTNDVLALQPGHGCRALKLTLQGKMEAAMNVLCFEHEIWCDVEPEPVEMLLRGLRRRIVREDVQIEDASAAWALFSVQGPAAAQVLAKLGIASGPPESGSGPAAEDLVHAEAKLAGVDVRIVRLGRSGAGGFDIWMPVEAAAAVWEAIASTGGARPAGLDALEIRRIEAGIPRQGREITPENFPQEAGLDAGWISYTKGCYLGQETIARIHHMGHVNRSLCGLILEPGADVPQPGGTLWLEEREVGRVTSAALSPRLARPVALAFVRQEQANHGVHLTVRTPSASRPAEVRGLPID